MAKKRRKATQPEEVTDNIPKNNQLLLFYYLQDELHKKAILNRQKTKPKLKPDP